jgi:hypothetical protein
MGRTRNFLHTPYGRRQLFSQFTATSRRVMQRAFREARRWQHDFVGTEHLLFGLLCDMEGSVAATLRSLNAKPELVLQKVDLSLQQHSVAVDQDRFPLSPALRRVFELADAEAANFRHQLIAPEHLMLGLMREQECAAAQILSSHGAELNELRIAVAQLPIEAMPEAQLRPGMGKGSAVPRSVSADDLEEQVMPIKTVDFAAKPPSLLATPAEIYAHLRRTQFALAALMGFTLGYWTQNWQVGIALALIGLGLAYLKQIWLSMTAGMSLPVLMMLMADRWPAEHYLLIPLVMLVGGIFGGLIGAVWRLTVPAPPPPNDEPPRASADMEQME